MADAIALEADIGGTAAATLATSWRWNAIYILAAIFLIHPLKEVALPSWTRHIWPPFVWTLLAYSSGDACRATRASRSRDRWSLVSKLEVATLLTLWFRTSEKGPPHVWTFFAHCALCSWLAAQAWGTINLLLLLHWHLAICTRWLIGPLEVIALFPLWLRAFEKDSATVRPFLACC